MLSFDSLLGGSNAPSDETRFDGYVLLHAEPQHQVLHALPTENSKQVILQREVKAGAARITLASRATAQLIIDAAGFVTFGAQDMKTAESDDFPMFGVDFGGNLSPNIVELTGPQRVRRLAQLLQTLFEKKVRVPTQ